MIQIAKVVSIVVTSKSSTDPTTVEQKTKTLSSECRICGVSAIGSSYGTVSCSSCKMFFKRNAEVGQEHFKCRYDGYCPVNINNRHVCSSCRLRKCFESGMQIELIRGSRSTKHATNRKRKLMTDPITTPSTALVRQDEREQAQHGDLCSLSLNDRFTLLRSAADCFTCLAIIQRTMKFIDPDTDMGYLIYRYGRDQAAIRFISLIQCLLAATDTVTDAQTIQVHINDIQSLVEQTELILILDDIER